MDFFSCGKKSSKKKCPPKTQPGHSPKPKPNNKHSLALSRMDGTPVRSGCNPTSSGMETEGASAGGELVGVTKLMNGLQEMGIEDLRQAFEMFDKNRDEKISADELGCVLRTLGFEYCQDEVDDMIKNADTNENGFVEYDEFLTMMQRFSQHTLVSAPTVDEKTREAFRVFDIDGNGYIDKQELRQVMKRLGENISEEDVKEMFREADLNNDGKIDFNEFRQLLGSCKLK